MEIVTNREGAKLTISLNGYLDTITSTDLDQVINNELDGVEELIFDFADLEYITSAGLRMVIKAKSMLQGSRELKIINVNDMIREVFGLTGLDDLLSD